MKKNHEKGDDHVTQSKKIRARSRWRTFQYGFKNSYTNQMTAKFFRYFDQNSSVKWSCHAIKENSRKVEMTNFSMYGFIRSLHLCKYSLISMRPIYYCDTWAIIWHDIVCWFIVSLFLPVLACCDHWIVFFWSADHIMQEWEELVKTGKFA